MRDTCASGQVLDTASGQRFFVSHAILMTELTLNNVCEDFGIFVGMFAAGQCTFAGLQRPCYETRIVAESYADISAHPKPEGPLI